MTTGNFVLVEAIRLILAESRAIRKRSYSRLNEIPNYLDPRVRIRAGFDTNAPGNGLIYFPIAAEDRAYNPARSVASIIWELMRSDGLLSLSRTPQSRSFRLWLARCEKS